MRYLEAWLLAIVALGGATFLDISRSSSTSRTHLLIIERFPVQLGNSWEYTRIFRTVLYDTLHNDTTDYLIVDSLHEEFQDTDRIAGWECYELKHVLFEDGASFPETWWYAHPDTALLWIADLYGTDSETPMGDSENGTFGMKDRSFDSPRALREYIDYIRSAHVIPISSDTHYWDPPKKLFVFPLQLGTSWVAMKDPWMEEREVVGEDSVSVPVGDFFSLRTSITSEWMKESDSWYIWIAHEGIIKDSLHMERKATDEEGDTIGYYVVDDFYELIDFQIGVGENPRSQPEKTTMLKVFPNPSRSVVTMLYSIASPAYVSLKVFNLSGRLVRTLVDEKQQSGRYHIVWDRRDSFGRELKSSTYLCRLETDAFVSIKKLVTLP